MRHPDGVIHDAAWTGRLPVMSSSDESANPTPLTIRPSGGAPVQSGQFPIPLNAARSITLVDISVTNISINRIAKHSDTEVTALQGRATPDHAELAVDGLVGAGIAIEAAPSLAAAGRVPMGLTSAGRPPMMWFTAQVRGSSAGEAQR